jgi:hypothetical protein
VRGMCVCVGGGGLKSTVFVFLSFRVQ